MHVVTLSAQDAPRYRALMLHAYEAAADAFTSTAEERATEPESWWIMRLADPKAMSVAFGAIDNGKLVGTVTIEFSSKPKTRHKAHLIGMFVMEYARGTGAGKALLAAALEAAKVRPEVQVITLTVTEGNLPATRLYESAGFKVFGVEPMAVATPGGFKSKVHMWLELPHSPHATKLSGAR
ncbi:GNAT family N-acetyltransferase [Curvibacter sp. CHRR-16]|uniref:GNAT family N-acetyltransferase n=1 Tax=Curvibacter sp. CHRR-16 TaxID=2835872 RepID=UPI001BDB686D|nr:GNAT family protein [Curvibacter sp. CHRR-16]MBT0571658.1 GNAT family N-acetyltransferase [Curvibacter sp. CHRR-16]